MKTVKIRFRFLLLATYIFITTSVVSAQTDIKPDSLPDACAANAESKHSIFASTGMGYNMVYMGTSLSQDKPYYSGGLVYGFRKELFVSASTFHLNAYDPFLSFSTFSLTWNHTFNKWFDIALSTSRYQVNKDLRDTLFSSFFYVDATMGVDWKILYTKISAGGILAESSGVYFQLRNSRYFETPSFFNDKAYFSFDPYVNMLFGTLTETSDGTTVITPPFRGGKSGSGSTPETTTKFSLMEIDLGIPVSFNIGRFTFDAEPGYLIPLFSDASSSGSGGFLFTMGIYFRIL
ncbi:MAG: hypothetical protein MUF36_05860 [Bacteroidales bacterium]|jgi:hypothetical protein|nr:hypothetical protein [Bacteroidales bacterium]